MANVKEAYGTAVTVTGRVTSLATSTTFVAGYEWYIWDNTTDLALDRQQQIKITVGTTPTANTEIRIYAIASIDGTTWPDVLDGVPSAETLTSEGQRDSYAKLAAVLRVDTNTSNRAYEAFFGLAALFGGTVPKKGAIFVTHNTGVNLNPTAGNHTYADLAVYETVT